MMRIRWMQQFWDEIRRYCDMGKDCIVGEIGLDYYWHKEKEEHLLQQKRYSASKWTLLREKQLRLSFIARDAAEDTRIS